jgi:DNA-binding response OmpR family regulator
MIGSILILEDSPTFADMMALRLSSAFSGYDILCANSLAQAVALTAQFQFDVVLADLDVGDCTGLETAVRVRNASQAPVVIYSGLLASPETHQEAMDNGFEDLFVKGQASSTDLIDRIQCLLDARALKSSNMPVGKASSDHS